MNWPTTAVRRGGKQTLSSSATTTSSRYVSELCKFGHIVLPKSSIALMFRCLLFSDTSFERQDSRSTLTTPSSSSSEDKVRKARTVAQIKVKAVSSKTFLCINVFNEFQIFWSPPLWDEPLFCLAFPFPFFLCFGIFF